MVTFEEPGTEPPWLLATISLEFTPEIWGLENKRYLGILRDKTHAAVVRFVCVPYRHRNAIVRVPMYS